MQGEMARDASQDHRVAAKARMERGDTGLHRGLEHERERNQERPSAADVRVGA